MIFFLFFFFQAEDGIRDYKVTGVQTCALPIYRICPASSAHCCIGSAALCTRVGAELEPGTRFSETVKTREMSRWMRPSSTMAAVLPSLSTGLRVRVQGSEEHTSELQSPCNIVCRLLLAKK